MNAGEQKTTRRGSTFLLLACGLVALIVLIGLGTWQVQRLGWKENLVATINSRVDSDPLPLPEIEAQWATTGDVDYWPVTLGGEYRHEGERHFFATHNGQSGYYIYTPFELDGGRYVLVNRGFVPFELKDASLRKEGQVEGWQTIVGLARNPLSEKPSAIIPDNDPAKNVFYWKDLGVMAETSGVGEPSNYLGFFVDANDAPNPGGLPVGGVTILDMPNSHLQYAVTWYGLALALIGVMGAWILRQRKP